MSFVHLDVGGNKKLKQRRDRKKKKKRRVDETITKKKNKKKKKQKREHKKKQRRKRWRWRTRRTRRTTRTRRTRRGSCRRGRRRSRRRRRRRSTRRSRRKRGWTKRCWVYGREWVSSTSMLVVIRSSSREGKQKKNAPPRATNLTFRSAPLALKFPVDKLVILYYLFCQEAARKTAVSP